MRFKLLLSLCVGASALACERGPVDPEPVAELPGQLLLTASASGVIAGRNISCMIEWILEVAPEQDHHAGTGGGEAFRQSLDDTGAGIAFWANAFTELRIDITRSGAVTLRSMRDGAPSPPVTDSRFWEGVRIFAGTLRDGDVIAEGPWTCYPMDARGDDAGTVTGTWQLTAR